jgi:PAS domain S-box-containing protein
VVVDRVLPSSPSSAREARGLLRDALHREQRDEWSDAGELAVSEIVTNALVHAGTPLHMQVFVNDTVVRVEVADESTHLPFRRDYSSTASTGRGLKMLQEVVDSWGADPRANGKVVWFELTDGPAEPAVRAPGAVTSTPGGRLPDVVEVELFNVPLLMHAAWQEHASAVLREYLLIKLDSTEVEILELHAAASDAMNVLFEQIPDPQLPVDPETLIVEAVEPGVSSERVVVTVPTSSVPHFEILNGMLDRALEVAEAGGLLSPPTQPEMRAMRRWLCVQVREQSTGGSPAPWSHTLGDSDAPTAPAVVWDPLAVSTSSRALVAADDANRIVAVSRAALAVLGYRDAGDLLGRRLMTIIPARYRQAHLAGFTLHLTNGRSPLLGTRVTVPVLRSDGTEVSVDLLVESQAVPHGRRLFTAELFPLVDRPAVDPRHRPS